MGSCRRGRATLLPTQPRNWSSNTKNYPLFVILHLFETWSHRIVRISNDPGCPPLSAMRGGPGLGAGLEGPANPRGPPPGRSGSGSGGPRAAAARWRPNLRPGRRLFLPEGLPAGRAPPGRWMGRAWGRWAVELHPKHRAPTAWAPKSGTAPRDTGSRGHLARPSPPPSDLGRKRPELDPRTRKAVRK